MLTLVIGPMWSGKTCHVIRLARRYRAIGKCVLFVNHSSDVRYGRKEPAVVTHDGIRERCVFFDRLSELKNTKAYEKAEVVVVEEAQFFPDAYDVISRECDSTNKHFIVSGLAGDYQRKSIGDILLLIPHAEYVEKLNGLCHQCKDGTPGCFTRRKDSIASATDGQILVGGSESYECVCRRHI